MRSTTLGLLLPVTFLLLAASPQAPVDETGEVSQRITFSRFTYSESVADEARLIFEYEGGVLGSELFLEIHGFAPIVMSSLSRLEGPSRTFIRVSGDLIFSWETNSNAKPFETRPDVEEYVATLQGLGDNLVVAFRASSSLGVVAEGTFRPNVQALPIDLTREDVEAFARSLSSEQRRAMVALLEMGGGQLPSRPLPPGALTILRKLLEVDHWQEAKWKRESEWIELASPKAQSFLAQFPEEYWRRPVSERPLIQLNALDSLLAEHLQ